MRHFARRWICALLLVGLAPAVAGADRHLLIVVGLGGEPHYSQQFADWSARMQEIAIRGLGLDAAHIRVLQADHEAAVAPTRDNIVAALRETAVASTHGDLVVLLLLGHGSDRNGQPRFNIPGPDLSAADLNAALAAFDGPDLVIVNATSASGGFVRELSAPRRVVITATAGAGEDQYAHFGGHFVRAFIVDAADADKDRRVSFLEAFAYAREAVLRAYEEDERILTEHALLDDNGDGVGSRHSAPALVATAADRDGDGALAATLYLQPGAGELAGATPGGRALLALDVAAGALVERVRNLRRRRARLAEGEYYRELETLLVALALNRRDFRHAESAAHD